MKARWTEINAITPTTNKHRNHPTCIHITKLLHNDLWLFALFTALIQCIKNHSFVCKGQGLPRTHYSGVNVFVFMSLCVRVCVCVGAFVYQCKEAAGSSTYAQYQACRKCASGPESNNTACHFPGKM